MHEIWHQVLLGELIVATHKSAEKRARQNVKRAARNSGLRHKLKTAVRAFREALTGKDTGAKEVALNHATRELRRAGSKGILPRQTVSRRVSRLELAFNANAKTA